MSPGRLLAFLVGGYLLFLVLTAPAWLAARLLPAGVQAAGYAGTLWSGRAARVQAAGLAGSVRWSLRPWPLLRGCLALQVAARLPEGRLQARVRRCLAGTTEVTGLAGMLPARLLARAAPGEGVQPAGRIRVRIDRMLVVDAWPVELEGTVRWQGARLRAPAPLVLGDLVARLGVQGARIRVRLDDAGGPLDVEGELLLVRDGTWHLEGTLAPRPGADAGLRQALALLGPADARGRHRFEAGGRLPRV